MTRKRQRRTAKLTHRTYIRQRQRLRQRSLQTRCRREKPMRGRSCRATFRPWTLKTLA